MKNHTSYLKQWISKTKFPIKCTLCDDGYVMSCVPYDNPSICDACNGTGYLTKEKYIKIFHPELLD